MAETTATGAKPVRLHGGALKWSRISDYCIASPPFTICRIFVGGIATYELWREKKFVARFKTAAEARAAANER